MYIFLGLFLFLRAIIIYSSKITFFLCDELSYIVHFSSPCLSYFHFKVTTPKLEMITFLLLASNFHLNTLKVSFSLPLIFELSIYN